MLSSFGLNWRWICCNPHIPINVSLTTLWKTITSRSLGVECIQPSMIVSGMLCISSYCINSSNSVQVSGRTCHKSIQISHSSGIMFDGISLACHRSQHVGRHSSSVSHHKDLTMDVLVGWVLKGLPLLHLTLWLLKD